MRNNIIQRTLHAALCLGVLVTCLMPATADEWNKKTTVTFSAPVEVPGKVLPPGTYVFRLLDSTSNRNVVQIWDKDEKQLYATIMGIPDYRLKTPEKPIIRFDERPSDTPEAVKAWFYPGDNYGVQFVYPHDQAVKLAKRTKQNVLSMRNDMAQNITAPADSKKAPSVQAMENTEVTGVNPAGDEIDLIVVVAPAPQR